MLERRYIFVVLAWLAILPTWGALPRESHWCGDSVLQNESAKSRTFLWALPSRTDRFTMGIRTRNLHSDPKRKYGRAKTTDYTPGQGLCAVSAAGDTLAALLMLHRLESPLETDDEMLLRVFMRRGGEMVLDRTESLSSGLLPKVSDIMSLRLTCEPSGIMIEAGEGALKPVAEFTGIIFKADSVGFILEAGAKVDRVTGTALSYDPLFPQDEKVADVAALLKRIDMSFDPLEGVWEYMDRQMDESLLRPGGEYQLLIVGSGDNIYDIYYAGGARVNPSRWRPGMKKGELRVMSPGRYILLWRDAEGEWMLHGLKGAMEDDGVLTLLFPYQTSSVRLRRMR